MGGDPVGGAYGAGAVWIADAGGRVLRVDPATRRVVSTTRLGGQVLSVAATEDGVWAEAGFPDTAIVRLDPATGRAAGTLVRRPASEGALVAAGGQVLVQGDRLAPGRLRRIDPGSNRLAGDYGHGWTNAVAADGDVLWTWSVLGEVERRDLATGRVLARSAAFPSGLEVAGWLPTRTARG